MFTAVNKGERFLRGKRSPLTLYTPGFFTIGFRHNNRLPETIGARWRESSDRIHPSMRLCSFSFGANQQWFKRIYRTCWQLSNSQQNGLNPTLLSPSAK